MIVTRGIKTAIQFALIVLFCGSVFAQDRPYEACTASVFNRTVSVDPESGAFELANVPTDLGYGRVRLFCTQNGVTLRGQSGLLLPQGQQLTVVGNIDLTAVVTPPVSVSVASNPASLGSLGETSQITVTGVFPDGTVRDISGSPDGSSYTSSNSGIVSVTAEGVATAMSGGTAIISARNEGTVGTVVIAVLVGNDADGDGIPDSYEVENGLNPNDPADAALDPDLDGLTNLQEFLNATLPNVADTDGDGLLDGTEVAQGTNPIQADTDGDGLPDGEELGRGTNPTSSDTDADGLKDGLELRIGLDPLRVDSDSDGILDKHEDTDGDLLTNEEEVAAFTDPGNPDTDGDGVRDRTEIVSGCDPLVIERTTVTGRVIDPQGALVAGAEVKVPGRNVSAIAIADGSFTLNNVLACPRFIRVSAQVQQPQLMQGRSASVISLVDGVTDMGSVVVREVVPTLYPGMLFDVGDRPVWYAAADFNQDTDIDLVTVNESSDDISILLSLGNGTFEPQQRLAVGNQPVWVAPADFDVDGAYDIVTVNQADDNISVLFGNGDGSFLPQVLLSSGFRSVSVETGDFNNDGFPDIAVINVGARNVVVFLSRGDKTFRAPTNLFTGVSDSGIKLAVADLNLDQKLDLIVPWIAGRALLVYLGLGNGSFQGAIRLDSGTLNSRAVVGDLNGDSNPDIFTDTFSIFYGNGNGTFQPRVQFPSPLTSAIPSIVNLNMDSFSDLVYSAFGLVYVFLGQGNGTFQDSGSFLSGTGSISGDFTGDATVDLATVHSANAVSIIEGERDGSFNNPERFTVGTRPTGLAKGDFNADGIQDLVISNQTTDNVSILYGSGDGIYLPQEKLAAGGGPSAVEVADVNNDGFKDIVTANTFSSDISVFLGLPEGSFQPQKRFSTGGFPAALSIGDINHDGKADVIAANDSSSTITVLPGNGNGTFGPRVTFNTFGPPKSVVLADVNMDSHLDIVASANALLLFLGNGNGTFQAERRFTVGAAAGAIAVRDVNSDGKLDVLASNSLTLSVLLGNGDASFQPVMESSNDGGLALEIADINLDGNLDTISLGFDYVSVRFGNGNGTFQNSLRFLAGYSPSDLIVDDVNSDGKLDIITTALLLDEVIVLLHK